MKVSVTETTPEEAQVLASALAEHYGDDVEVFAAGGEEPLATADEPAETAVGSSDAGAADAPLDSGLGPTERERQLREEIEAILQGPGEVQRTGVFKR